MKYTTQKQRAHQQSRARYQERRKRHKQALIRMVGVIDWREKLANGRAASNAVEALRNGYVANSKIGKARRGFLASITRAWAQSLVAK